MSPAKVAPPNFDLGDELNGDLQYSSQTKLLTRINPRFSSLPERPGVKLDAISIHDVLKVDLLTPALDRIAPFLWLVSTPRSSHILLLHRQRVRGRNIVLCEEPGLHLIWYHDKIFVKPLPGYLLSYAFWAFCKENGIFSPSDRDDRKRTRPLPAALGLLRSYSYLVKYPADMNLAQEIGLLPQGLTLEKFTEFIRSFEATADDEVSRRYTFGELRLTRLNLLTPILLFPRLTYHHMTPQWNSFFGALLAPALTIFAIFSVILTAMQVELGVEALPVNQAQWRIVSDVSRWFAVVTLLLSASLIAFLIMILLFFVVHEQAFALGILWKKRGGREEKEKKTSAIV